MFGMKNPEGSRRSSRAGRQAEEVQLGTNVTSLLFAEVQVAVLLVQSIRTTSLKLPQKKRKEKKENESFLARCVHIYKKKKEQKPLWNAAPTPKINWKPIEAMIPLAGGWN